MIYEKQNHWIEYEPGNEYEPIPILEPGDAVLFNGLTTHAGDGEHENMRLFVGLNYTPDEYSIDTGRQSYYNLDGQNFKQDYYLDRIPIAQALVKGNECGHPELMRSKAVGADAAVEWESNLLNLGIIKR